MDLEQALAISSSGLSAQKQRLEIISGNLANIETTRTAAGGPYRRKDVVFTAAPLPGSFPAMLADSTAEPAVSVSQIVTDPRPPRTVHAPQHPDADAAGNVAFPNVNPTEEMVNMISALRSYEANITALNATKSMLLKTLEIGK